MSLFRWLARVRWSPVCGGVVVQGGACPGCPAFPAAVTAGLVLRTRLRELVAARDTPIAEQDAVIAVLREELAGLRWQVADLTARPRPDSRNPGKPPSCEDEGGSTRRRDRAGAVRTAGHGRGGVLVARSVPVPGPRLPGTFRAVRLRAVARRASRRGAEDRRADRPGAAGHHEASHRLCLRWW